MTTAIVTDSGCDLPPGLEKQLGIQIVPLLFRFGMQEFADKSISMQEFLQRIAHTWPASSAPSVGDYAGVFQNCLTTFNQVVCITVSSKHSASYSAALVASQQFPPGQVSVIDSESLSIGQGFLVQAAALAARLEDGGEKIIARIKDLQRRSHLYIILDTVEYLVRGGRANPFVGTLAAVFKIRPVLTLVQGQLTLLDRQRGRKASKERLLELALGHFPAELAAVGHIACAEEASELRLALSGRSGVPQADIPIVEVGMALATHGGPGTLGAVVVSKG